MARLEHKAPLDSRVPLDQLETRVRLDFRERLEQKESLELLVHKAIRELEAILVHRASKDSKVTREILASLDRQEIPVHKELLAQQALKDSQEILEHRAAKDCQGYKVLWDYRDPKDWLAVLAWLELLVELAQLVYREQLEIPDNPELRAKLANRGCRATLARQELLERQDQEVTLDLWELRVCLVSLEQLEILVHLAISVLKDLLVYREQLVQLVILDHQDLLDSLGLQVCLVHRAKKGKLVNQVSQFWVRREFKEPRDLLEHLVIPDQLALLEYLDNQVPLELLERREVPGQQGSQERLVILERLDQMDLLVPVV